MGKASAPGHPGAGVATATVRYVLSPLPDALGRYHTECAAVEAGHPVRHYLPKHQGCLASINGGVIPPEDYDTRVLQADEELLLKPQIRIPAAILLPALVQIVAGIAIGIASAFILRALFPPQRPKFQEQDDPTYGFEGIRSTVGAGAKVPVIYGRHRVGGQIIQASVETSAQIHATDGNDIHYQVHDITSVLQILLALGEGEINAVGLDSIQLNGQPITNFPQVNTRVAFGTPDQGTLPGFAETHNSFADGREITPAGIVYTTTAAVDAYQVVVAFNEGLARFTSQGERIDNRVRVGFRHRVNGTQTWSVPNIIDIRHTSTATVRAGLRRTQLPRAVYDIEAFFIFAAGMGDNARFRPFLESVLEIQVGAQPYPNTALLGLSALATENLSGAIPNTTVIIEGIKVRVGSFNALPTYSTNPAWCLMDYLTNARYGLGIPDAEINLPSFQQFANYCNQVIDGAPRHTLNIVIVDDAEAVILQILNDCRGVLYKIQGQWTLLALQDEPPVQLLSWSNCTNVRLSYTRDPDHINVMEGRFADETDDYEQAVITWPTEENWPVHINKTTIDLRGVTNRPAVMRHLQYELNRRTLPKLTLTMDCSMDALALTVNDIFRFSHPLPGWGVAGRLQEGSTTTVLHLDEAVTCTANQAYHIYIRHDTDLVETKTVVNPGNATVRQVTITSPLALTPTPLTTLYAFGESSPLDTAIREFRVVKLERLTDNTIRINAVQHNPSIYDDPVAVPLPVTDTLFNPLGPPPPLTHLVLTEFPRIGPDGRQRVVANLAWDVAALSAGYAPYGGALIYRREVGINAMAGGGEMGAVALAEVQSATDISSDFVRIATVGPLVLDYDDALVITGITYEYMVVPISSRGVPNNEGALRGILHISGALTPDYYPGTIQNLRLVGQLPGQGLFEGPDVHIEWDKLTHPLFTESFFLKEYVVEVWATAQAYRLRLTTTTAERYTYTLQQNQEDQLAAGFSSARRDLLFLVRGRTNTGRESLTPAELLASNPPPDMSSLTPVVTPLFQAAIVDWTFYIQPRDISHYIVQLDTISPPNAILSNISQSFQKVFPQGLEPGTRYYVQIIPFDTFGMGIPSGIADFLPRNLNVFDLDTLPPPTPTNLTLTTGTSVGPDGALHPYIEAAWEAPIALDLSGYQVNFRSETAGSPTVLSVDADQTSVRLEGVAGGLTYFVKVAAFDHFRNTSPFTSEASIVTGTDADAPDAPQDLLVRGFFQAHVLSWRPPPNADLATIEIWASPTNDRSMAYLVVEVPGTSAFYTHTPLDYVNTPPLLGEAQVGEVTTGSQQVYTLWYWLRAKDRSGNVSTFFPPGETEGVSGTALLLGGDVFIQDGVLLTQAAQIGNAIITDAHIQNLSASKLLAGTIDVLIRLGVGNIELDAPHDVIRVKTPQGVVTIEMGLLDQDNTLSRNYGIRIYDPNGVLLFDASQQGITEHGIPAGVINAGHIRAEVIDSTHLRADIAIITTAAQIANALIDTAHIQQAAIVAAHIADAAIGTAQIQDAAITSAKIRDLEVTNAKIENLTVGTEKIQDNAVNITVALAQATTTINTNVETSVNGIVATDIAPNASIVLTYTGIISAGPNFTNRYRLRIRADNVFGPVLTQLGRYGANGDEDTFCAIQAVWQNTGVAGSRQFLVTVERDNSPTPTGDPYTVQGQLVMQVHQK